MSVKPPHFPAKVKNVIYLFMAGAPSQLELFDYKPALNKYDGHVAPDSLLYEQTLRVHGYLREKSAEAARREAQSFQRYGKSGMHFSELLPNIATVADRLTMIHGISTENFNHAPAKCFMNTGFDHFQGGREHRLLGDLRHRQQIAGSAWIRGAAIRSARASRQRRRCGRAVSADVLPGRAFPVGWRSDSQSFGSEGVPTNAQQQTLQAIHDLNELKLEETGDSEIGTRIAAYETAYRMQTSGPELIDFSKESRETLEMYGVEPGKATFANNCLLAARLVEAASRFVQLYHTDWDRIIRISARPLDQVRRSINR